MKIKPIVWLGVLAVGISSCMKDEVVLQDGWDTYSRPLNFGAPIATGHFSATDLLKILDDSSLIQTDSTGLISAQYQQNFLAEWNDIISLAGISIDRNYDINPARKSTSSSLGFEEHIPINSRADQIIDSMIIATSSLVIDINSPADLQGTIDISIPELVKDGKVLSYSTQIGTPFSKTEDLSGYALYPLHVPDSSYFRVLVTVNVETPTSIPTETNVEVKLVINDLIPEVTFGYFGDSSVINQDYEFNVPVFDNLKLAGLVEFKGMTIELNADNYYGIPFSLSLNNTMLERRQTGDQLIIDFLDGNSIDLNPATHSSPVIPTHNYIKFDSVNSNINEAVNFFPDHMMFNVDAKINPSGVVTHDNFVTQINKFEGIVNLNLPFWFRTSAFLRTDTIGFDFEQLDSLTVQQLERLNFNFIFNNGFPFDITAQAYLTNDLGVVIDSLFDSAQSFWVAGQLNSDDKVVQPTEHPVSVNLTRAQVQKYRMGKAKNIILYIRAITADNGSRFVKLYDTYSVDFSLSVSLVGRTSSN